MSQYTIINIVVVVVVVAIVKFIIFRLLCEIEPIDALVCIFQF